MVWAVLHAENVQVLVHQALVVATEKQGRPRRLVLLAELELPADAKLRQIGGIEHALVTANPFGVAQLGQAGYRPTGQKKKEAFNGVHSVGYFNRW